MEEKIIQRTLDKISSHISKVEKKKANEKDLTFKQKVYNILMNIEFMCFCLALTGLYYMVTGIQYWLPYYMMNNLDPIPGG